MLYSKLLYHFQLLYKHWQKTIEVVTMAWWDSWFVFKRIVTKDHMEVWFSKRNKWEKLREQRWYWKVSIDILHWFCICFLYHLPVLSLSKIDVLKMFLYSILSWFCKKNQYNWNVLVWETQKLVNKQNFAPFFVCLDKFNCFLHFIIMFHLVIITTNEAKAETTLIFLIATFL